MVHGNCRALTAAGSTSTDRVDRVTDLVGTLTQGGGDVRGGIGDRADQLPFRRGMPTVVASLSNCSAIRIKAGHIVLAMRTHWSRISPMLPTRRWPRHIRLKLSEAVRQRREELGITQAELSERDGL